MSLKAKYEENNNKIMYRSEDSYGTLFWLLDRTQTNMGSRLLKKWISKPLCNEKEILIRQDIVASLISNFITRDDIKRDLKDIYDLERQIRRQLKINELEDNFIYVDGTSYINDKKVITGLNKTLNVTTKSSIVLPAIIYFKDNVPEDYIDSSEYLFKVGSFEQLIDKYELGK